MLVLENCPENWSHGQEHRSGALCNEEHNITNTNATFRIAHGQLPPFFLLELILGILVDVPPKMNE